MDRKAWLIVTLCGALMALNFWYMQKETAYKQKIAQEKLEREKAEKAAQGPSASAPAASAAAGTAAAPAPAEAASKGAAEQTRELKSGSVTYVLTTKGGGIKKAVLAAQDQVVLNLHGKDAIGAFRRDANVTDDITYSVVEATDQAVTFEGVDTVSGLGVRKTYALTTGEGSEKDTLSQNQEHDLIGPEAQHLQHHLVQQGVRAAGSAGEDDGDRPLLADR